MDDGAAHDEIVEIEARIDVLSDELGRCRKYALLARVAIAAGGALLVVAAIGVVRLNAIAILAAITALIGGTVLLGSNRGTLEHTLAALRALEARRAALIGEIELKLVGD